MGCLDERGPDVIYGDDEPGREGIGCDEIS
jgi:hypothetical protein